MDTTEVMLYEGRRLAIKLVQHVRRCSAAGATIPCRVGGVPYLVKVEEISSPQAEDILAEAAQQEREAHKQFGVGA